LSGGIQIASGNANQFAAVPPGCSYIIALLLQGPSTLLLVTIAETYSAPILATGLSAFTRIFDVTNVIGGMDVTSYAINDPTANPLVVYYSSFNVFSYSLSSLTYISASVIPSVQVFPTTLAFLPIQLFWSTSQKTVIAGLPDDSLWVISIAGHGATKQIPLVKPLPVGSTRAAFNADIYYSANDTHVIAVNANTGALSWGPTCIQNGKFVQGNFVFLT